MSETIPPPPSSERRFPFVDGLRGVAAMAVFGFHVWPYAPAATPLRYGWLGVQAFFVLSGFVIAHSLRNAAVTPRFLANFALRRSIRLDPPYWVAIALTVVLIAASNRFAGGHGTLPGPGALLAHVFYLQGILGIPQVLDTFWSLCLEIQLYLLYAVALGVSQTIDASRRRAGRAPSLPLVLAPLFVLSTASTFLPFVSDDFHRSTCLVYLHEFLLGALLCNLRLGRLSPRLGLAAVAVAATGLASAYRLDTAVSLGVTGLLYAAIRTGGLEKWLSGRVFQLLGTLSYSFYLLHPLVVSRMQRLMERTGLTRGAWLLILPVLAASLFAAWLLYRLVERPSLELARRLKPKSEGARPSSYLQRS